MLVYKQYNVEGKSKQFVKKVWCLDNFNNSKTVSGMSILPNGCQNIAIVHGLGVNVHTKHSEYKLNSGTYLSGQMTSRVKVEIQQHTKIILLQLYPWTLSSLFNTKGFIDQIKPVSEDYLGTTLPLSPQTVDCPMKLAVTINVFFNNLKAIPTDSLVEIICRKIFEAQGRLKIADLLACFEFSKRKIQVAFKQSTGLSIKQFNDIVRLRSTVNSIMEGKDKVADVATEHEYFDQSHLVKTFNQTVGVTPSKFEPKKFIMPPKSP